MSCGNSNANFKLSSNIKTPETPKPETPTCLPKSKLPTSTSLLPRLQSLDVPSNRVLKRNASEFQGQVAKKSRIDKSPVFRRRSDEKDQPPPKTRLGAARLRKAQSTYSLAPRKPSVPQTNAFRMPRKPLGVVQGNSTSSYGTKTSKSPPRSVQPAKSVAVPEKRPKWDVKGRLEDLEKQMTQLSQEKKQCTEKIAKNEDECEMLKKMNIESEETASKYRTKLEDVIVINASLEKEIRQLKDKEDDLQRENKKLKADLEVSEESVSDLKGKCKLLKTKCAKLEEENEEMTTKEGNSSRRNKELMEEVVKLKEKVEEQHENLLKEETMRRALHNQVQELKGNIRVYCRIRPLIKDEVTCSPYDLPFVTVDTENSLTIFSEKYTEGNNRKVPPQEFTFDRVFGPKHCQEEVFQEISQLVQSALDGYNVCIFAYGQTGSGKTYTMEGNGEDTGMIARAVTKVFETCQKLKYQGWNYSLKASVLEIYNEQIRDLLTTSQDKLDLHLVGSEVTVSNLKVVDVSCEGQIQQLLEKAQKNRAVAATECNNRSSRSHSVFQLRITGKNDVTSESCDGTLNLVDLAGSEKLKQSKSEGQRAVEAKNINLSLSNLGNVILALGQKSEHVPFRNSKLTFLLQNSLGGNSKTLMFVNVSPGEQCFSETINSLRFASKVNQCNVGVAKRKCKKV